MASGDVKPIKSNYHKGGGYGGHHSSHYYDDEGRGQSKEIWVWFEENFNAASDKVSFLMDMGDARYYWLLKGSVERFGLMDIAYLWEPGYRLPKMDTRAHRLVTKTLSEKVWLDFHSAAVDAYNREVERLQKERHEAAVKSSGEWEAYMAQRKAQAAKELEDDLALLTPTAELTAGMFSTDMALAFKSGECYDVGDGDFIESPVDVICNAGGWGRETQKATGVKLQITVWLDLSNSMRYNGVHQVSAAAFRDLSLTLARLENEYAGHLFFTYGYWSENSFSGEGKGVRLLKSYEAMADMVTKELDNLRPSQIEAWYGNGPFNGTDTWISPLLAKIAEWENQYSDPGACRLDVILTDAVLEHAVDIRAADTIQTKRNGNLSTVLLNFMPEKDWLKTRLPARCYQLHVDVDTVAGILRNLIAEFVTANI